ncbi:hypothetical protein COT44_03520 [Candidatus Shapirobacteria bacterium CG08_land_8_20_14_0_20_39_18]|uniref:Uncharacterized protein n=1 Tax=Candidatus Shapirobacteria bacterium CG08_land_8_20_14_0_20_39_18 TaxID=1974883 RepID=A0A2M6XCS9_9BACT|nr:MAG: hypothetical protein COT44_03520 [Candidatus Shapirobacteria bacterium CG08_land_8_20_14_0_20_39_18]PIY65130.1 MAG: hypothetical protein COY91_03630 [Candidatus Shapirobacteria bacterium CG_4_10_14_0_8_um_filter_39_15]PJE68155.1 MAG: hypothetical protein COU94_03390 [Candidatus Shapirobacteria bacterium CG10_big_fil_rev_8_21_14_0_10_38_8]
MKTKIKAKQKAWEFYEAWRQVKSNSPALGCEVRVSLLGWRHITGATGAKKRTFKDMYWRLKLLPYAKQIIETSTTVQNISERKGRKYYALEAMIEIEQDNSKSMRKVRVILLEDKQGNKIFYSVMDKKSGSPHA